MPYSLEVFETFYLQIVDYSEINEEINNNNNNVSS